MSKKVLVISCSLRGKSNTEAMAESFAEGARSAGNDVETVSLKGKELKFCRGCCVCQEKGRCVIEDGSNAIVDSIYAADAVVLAFPIYYYDMPGQLKTLIDRSNWLYASDYHVRDIYALMACSDDSPDAIDGPMKGISGWSVCLPKTRIAGKICAYGTTDPGTVSDAVLKECREMGGKV